MLKYEISSENRIKIKGSKYFNKNWLVLDDGDGRWRYVCKDLFAYIFIDIMDLPEWAGSEALCLWSVSVSVVDAISCRITMDEIDQALHSSGLGDTPLNLTKEGDALQLATALFDHGNKATLWTKEGGELKKDRYGWLEYNQDGYDPTFKSLRLEARKWAEGNLLSESNRERLLSTTIANAIGQTAREYASGSSGMWDALRRIKKNPNATDRQKLVLKLYKNAEKTLSGETVPEDLRRDG